jgi:hypothetical protein
MVLTELIDSFAARGVRLEVDGDRLRFFPRSAVTQEDVALLRAHKAPIIRLLTDPPEPPPRAPETPAPPASDPSSSITVEPSEPNAAAPASVPDENKHEHVRLLLADLNCRLPPGRILLASDWERLLPFGDAVNAALAADGELADESLTAACRTYHAAAVQVFANTEQEAAQDHFDADEYRHVGDSFRPGRPRSPFRMTRSRIVDAQPATH